VNRAARRETSIRALRAQASPVPTTGTARTALHPLAVERFLDIGTVLLLPALMIYLGFNAGGYFAGTTGWAAAALAIVLAVRVAVSGRALTAPSLSLALAAAVLALFAGWTLLSGGWSGNYGRSLIEFDRALLYLLVLLAFGSIQAPRHALRYLPIGLALAAVILCAAGLATRTLPDLWPFTLPSDRSRLAYPVTYSNGLGILASLGIVACLHISSWDREPLVARILAAAALPLLTATLVLTFSRGAILAGAIGVLVYAVLGRPRGLLTAVVGVLPFVALAAYAAYDAELLATEHPTSSAAMEQGREAARTVGAAMLGGGAFLSLLLPLERRLGRQMPKPSRPVAAVIAAAVLIGVATAAVLKGPDAVRSLREDIVGKGSSGDDLTRERVTSPTDLVNTGGQSRVEYWRIALDAFEDEPIRGTGVGTFAERWARDRPTAESATEGHSVYLETLGELGVVGASLIVVVLAMLVRPFIMRLRRGRRPLQAAGLALAAAWLVHAGIEWDWELPVLTLWLFAFGGCALAASPARLGRPRAPAPLMRLIVVFACLLIAVTPATIAVSQSRLDAAVAALVRGDCGTAERLASEASSALPPRAEPYEILAYCHSRAGQHRRAVAMMKQAIERDPHDWELVYGLAVVRAAGGEDPSGAARRALRLNPREQLTRAAAERFAAANPGHWRRQARAVPLPLP
jgi:O-antigen ligase